MWVAGCSCICSMANRCCTARTQKGLRLKPGSTGWKSCRSGKNGNTGSRYSGARRTNRSPRFAGRHDAAGIPSPWVSSTDPALLLNVWWRRKAKRRRPKIKGKPGDLNALLRSGYTWTVEANPDEFSAATACCFMGCGLCLGLTMSLSSSSNSVPSHQRIAVWLFVCCLMVPSPWQSIGAVTRLTERAFHRRVETGDRCVTTVIRDSLDGGVQHHHRQSPEYINAITACLWTSLNRFISGVSAPPVGQKSASCS